MHIDETKVNPDTFAKYCKLQQKCRLVFELSNENAEIHVMENCRGK